MLKKYTAILLGLLCLASVIPAQQNEADSLLKVLEKSSGRKKVDLLITISDLYQYIDSRKAIEYCQTGLELARKLHYKKAEANLLSGLGYHYTYVDQRKALDYSFQGLELRKEIGDIAEISSSYSNLGIIFYVQGRYREAVDYLHKSLKIRENLSLKEAVGMTSNNLSLVYMAMQSYDIALKYQTRSKQIFTELKDSSGIAVLTDNIGETYRMKGDYDRALSNYYEALAINRRLGNVKMSAYSLQNIGRVMHEKGRFDDALSYYNESLKIYERLIDKNGIAQSRNRMAKVYQQKGDYKKAIANSLLAYSKAGEINSIENIAIASEILGDAYQKLGDYKKAYKYLSENRSVVDSLKNIEKVKDIVKVEMEYSFNKIQKENEISLQKQKFFNSLLLVVICSFAVVVLLVFRQNKLKQKTNRQLNRLNDELSAINSMKDRLFSIIAHDLRNPFHGIMNSAKLLGEKEIAENSAERQTLVDIIFKSAENGFELLENLLLWARKQTGSIPMNFGNINLSVLIDESIALVSTNSRAKNICIESLVDRNITAYADYFSVSTIVRNLLSNSIKYTPAGGRVSISASVENDIVRTTVSDTGVGIEQENIAKLFRADSFFSTPGTEHEKGSGLGLLLCKEFVEANGGTICVENNPERQGVSFTFTLPKGRLN